MLANEFNATITAFRTSPSMTSCHSREGENPSLGNSVDSRLRGNDSGSGIRHFCNDRANLKGLLHSADKIHMKLHETGCHLHEVFYSIKLAAQAGSGADT